MDREDISTLENFENRLYNLFLELKNYVAEKKGEIKAYELNSSKIIKLPSINTVVVTEDEEEMTYKKLNMRLRKDNRYEIRFIIGDNRHSAYGKTKKDCYEKYKLILSEYEKAPKKAIKKTALFNNWLDEWYSLYKTNLKSHEVQTAIRLHIKPYFENKAVTKLTANDIQNALNKVGLSRTSVTVYNTINECLESAVANKIIKENPCKYIKRPKHIRAQGKAFSIEEESNFLTQINGKECESIFKFMLYSGVRRSEALNLKWADIDVGNSRIHIIGTKTVMSDREIPIFPKLEELLQNIERKEGEENVFGYKNADSITKAFVRLNITGHKLHDLRHTFATRCIEKGVPMKYVQLWLGHSNYQTTANIYTHANNKEYENELIKLLNFDPIFDPIFDPKR